MFDWKEFFPVDALAPLLGGLAIWFGVNYLVLAPDIIAPRLAERVYVPACVAAVEQNRVAMRGQIRAMDEEMAAALIARRDQLARQAQAQTGAIMGELLGALGPEGRSLGAELTNQLMPGGGMVGIAADMEMQKQRAAAEQERNRRLAEIRGRQRFDNPQAFCGCNASQGLSDRLELALYTSSLRLYEPARLEALARGDVVGDACGAPPVL